MVIVLVVTCMFSSICELFTISTSRGGEMIESSFEISRFKVVSTELLKCVITLKRTLKWRLTIQSSGALVPFRALNLRDRESSVDSWQIFVIRFEISIELIVLRVVEERDPLSILLIFYHVLV